MSSVCLSPPEPPVPAAAPPVPGNQKESPKLSVVTAFLFPGGPPELFLFRAVHRAFAFSERSLFLSERSFSHFYVWTSIGGPFPPADLVDSATSQLISYLPGTWPSAFFNSRIRRSGHAHHLRFVGFVKKEPRGGGLVSSLLLYL